MNKKLFDVFDIDLNRLEEEAADQPLLYIHYSKLFKKAKKKLSEQKAALELAESEISLDIRLKPKKYGLPEKLTEKLITVKIISQKKYKKALSRFYKAKDKSDTFQIYVNALEHRRKMISDLVQLHGQDYFSKPYVPSGMRKIVSELEQDKIHNAATEKVKKKRRKK